MACRFARFRAHNVKEPTYRVNCNEYSMNKEDRKILVSRLRGLYVILDAQFLQNKDIVGVAASVLSGGAKILQVRDKLSDKGDILESTKRIRDICEDYGSLLIVNDHVDLAVASNAHGVHLGQHDLPIEEARNILLPWQLIGTSNATVDEASESMSRGADYIAVGAIFPTTTKGNTRPAGLNTLTRVKELAFVPVVAIGGINESNVAQVIDAGADAVCVISAVIGAADPESAAGRMASYIS
jgi:thiamine-phosphate pyrophosphorylase